MCDPGEHTTMMNFTSLRLLILALFLAVPFVPTAVPATKESASAPANDAKFYTIRRDLRRCASPMCGGYFIKLVNQPRMRCANGKSMSECYVASIDWNGMAEPERVGSIVRGSHSTRGDRRGTYGVLQVSEVWLPAGDGEASGTFFRVRDRGLRCIAAPCETHSETKLNTSVSRNVAGVDLAVTGASESAMSEAFTTMTSPDGVLVAGTHEAVSGPAGRSQQLNATQFYLRANPSTSDQNPKPSPQKPCFKTGCSKQVCADEEVMTTCEYRAEYACYKKARCERQTNGQCGFTDTPELRTCLRRN